METLKMLSALPNVRKIEFGHPGWRSGTKAQVNSLKSHARVNNLDISYEINGVKNLDMVF